MRWYSITGLDEEQLAELVERCSGFIQWDKLRGRRKALGFSDAIIVTLAVTRKNFGQADLAAFFNVGQSTISRVFRLLRDVVIKALSGFVWKRSEVKKGRIVLIDSTLVPTGSRAGRRDLYSGKRRKAGMNIVVVGDTRGNLLAVTKPVPGSMHDAKSFRRLKLHKIIPTTNTIGDLAYIGCGIITGFKKSKLRALRDDEREVNARLNKKRAKIEHIIGHLKNWKILSTGYRGRLNDLPKTIAMATILEFYRTTTNPF